MRRNAAQLSRNKLAAALPSTTVDHSSSTARAHAFEEAVGSGVLEVRPIPEVLFHGLPL